MAAASSPSSSPRLPSPPPFAEDQIGPTSPGVSLFDDHRTLLGGNNVDSSASRRVRPGTKAEDIREGPPLVELAELDSAFQLTEHLKALHYAHTHPADSNELRPVTAELARQWAHPPLHTAKEIWLYELGRFLIQKTNAIIVHLFSDDPPCSAQTCPEMRASEWQYLCAVHDPPKSCSAIDYCCHTLDWAATSLTSSKTFPSRLGLGSGSTGGGNDRFLAVQMKEITNIFRRVYRIYAHAWFQHRDVFWDVEGKTGLYIFFKTVCDEYGLIQAENYTIPLEAEGQQPAEGEVQAQEKSQAPSIIKRDENMQERAVDLELQGNCVISHGGTAKHHRSPSTMSSSLSSAIQEETEEEEDQQQSSSVNRSSTILHDEPEEQEEHKELRKEEDSLAVKEDDLEEEPPLPGISRSDTIKPEKQSEEMNASETTVVSMEAEPEPKAEPEVETKPDEPRVEVKVEEIELAEPTSSLAADEEEATKTVAD